MAVKGKKAQKQQQKPVPKLVKPPKEEEEEDDDDVEDEEQEEQSDEEVVAEKDEKVEEDEDDDEEDDEDEEDDDAEEKAEEKKEASKDSEDDKYMQTTIFVGHINYQLKQQELNDFFGKVGEIESSRVITKRGYAFITYKDAASVAEALKLDKEILCGKAVHVERVKTKRSDSQQNKQLKRKQNKEQNEQGAKRAKVEGKMVKPRKYFPSKGEKGGKPKSHPNKPAGGKFVKSTA